MEQPVTPFDRSLFVSFLDKFDTRIIEQARNVYDALPEVMGMHFTQISQAESIRRDGFIAKDSRPNYVYVFDKRATDESFGDNLARADMVGLKHYNVRETIGRFHKAFVEGLNKYGLEDIKYSPRQSSESVYDFLISNKDRLPAIVFADISSANSTQKDENKKMLPSGYFSGLESGKVMKVISIGDSEIEEVADMIEKGTPIDIAFKRKLMNKTLEWLLLRAEEHKQEVIRQQVENDMEETKKNPISLWRKKYDDEFGADVVDRVIQKIKDLFGTDNDDSHIKYIDGSEYLTSTGISMADILFEHVRAEKELRIITDKSSVNDGMIIQSLQVHSFGGVELLKLGKYKAAGFIVSEAQKRFGRPPESIIYFGSLDDVELAILTGAKEIYLVDPGLDEEFVKKMIERISKYADNVYYNDAEKMITFDITTRHVVVKIYEQTMQDFNEENKVKAEVVVLFNKAPGMSTTNAESAVLPGGFCVDNRSDYPPEN